MKEKEIKAFADKIAEAEKSRGILLMSRVFSSEAQTLLAGNKTTTVMVMVETRENRGEEALKKLGKTLESAPKEEKIIFELRPKYGDAKITASPHVIATLPSVRPEITDIYLHEPLDVSESSKPTTTIPTWEKTPHLMRKAEIPM